MKRCFSRVLCFFMIAVLLAGITGLAAAESRVTQVLTGKKGAALRSQPDANSTKLTGIHQNVYLEVEDQQNGWFFVYYNGMYGWVSATMVTVTKVDTITPPPAEETDYDNDYDYDDYGSDDNWDSYDSRSGYNSQDPYDMGVPYIGNAVFRENQMNLIVLWVQTQLKATGVWYQGYQWDVTGNLGDHTMSEIRSFMSANGNRSHTGVVDQKVIDALAKYLGNNVQPVMIGGFYNSMRMLMNGDSYGTMQPVISNLRDMKACSTNGARWVQSVLKGLGYYTGTIDGMYGEGTDRAVRRFQNDNGFQERDYVTLGVARCMLEQYYYRGLSLGMLP